MKKTLYFFVALVILVPVCTHAQNVIHTQRRRTGKPVKDNLQISCLLQNAVEAPPKKQAYDLGVQQPLLRISSTTDSLVKAGLNGVVNFVQSDGKGKMEVVYYFQDYYIWVSGLSKVNVVKNQKVQPNDVIGTLNPGEILEILVTDYDTEVDPRKYIQCVIQPPVTEGTKK